MMNLFEIMRQAQGGNAMQNLSRQFGLSPDQAQTAVEALLPAFQMGLQRQTQNAEIFGNFIQQLATGQHAQFVDHDGDGIPDEAVPMGQDVLAQLFGPKAVSNAVTQQAAAMSGVSNAIMKAMLPVIASMIMGGLFKGMNNRGFGDVLGQIAGQMMGGGNPMGNAQAGGRNPFEDILGGMLGGGQRQQAPANPMGDILGQILGGMTGGGRQASPQSQQSDMMQQGLEALTEMFNAGTRAQTDHMNNMQSIFEDIMGGGRR